MLPRTLAAAAALLAAPALVAPRAASAQTGGDGYLFRRPAGSFVLRGGYDRALAGSDFFTDATTRLTLDRGSFSAPNVGADLAFTLRDRLDLVLGAAWARSGRTSEYRNFIGDDDRPLDQRTTFTRVPVSASLRYYLAPRGERVGSFAWIPGGFAPYVTAGAGASYYTLRQNGWVLNEQTLRARLADLRSSGWAAAVLAGAGVDYSLSPRFLVTTEARYTRASAPLRNNFVGFAPLDLSGVAVTAGLGVRF